MTTHTIAALRRVALHLTAAATRTRRAIEALRARNLDAPPDAIALLSDLDAAALGMDEAAHPPAALRVVISQPATCPPGKVADAEIHWLDGCFAGLKFIGFAIWERRTGGAHSVTFPARSYQVNGERRSFALLRPVSFDAGLKSDPQNTIRDLILDAYRRTAQAGETAGTWAYHQDGSPWTPRTIDLEPTPPAGIAQAAQDAATYQTSQPPRGNDTGSPDEAAQLRPLAQAAQVIAQAPHLDAGIILGNAIAQAASNQRHPAAAALDHALDTAQAVARAQQAPAAQAARPRRF